jgi:PhnB protein
MSFGTLWFEFKPGDREMQIYPYFTLDGNCEEAFRFYQQTLGGRIEAMVSHEGTPAEVHVPAEWRKKLTSSRAGRT